MDNGFFPKQPKPNWDPRQLEIEYFWPLTEQISLDLDYEGCATKNPYVYGSDIGLSIVGGTGTTITYGTPTWSSALSIEADTITFGNLKMPWYRKLMFKLMGFKWKND